VLASVDAVTAALRARLGEEIKAIERDSEPLPQVSTSNLDALRAYALGQRDYGSRKLEEADLHYSRAIELDPGFALAYVGKLRINVARGRFDEARRLLDAALANSDRLPPRDALYLSAWRADLGAVPWRTAASKWKQLADTYPDYFAGHVNYANTLFFVGRYADSVAAMQPALVVQNPFLALDLDTLGRFQLASNQLQAALQSFEQANAITKAPSRQYASALAASGSRAAALKLLDKHEARLGLPAHLDRIAILIDDEQYDQALVIAAQAQSHAKGEDPLLEDLFETVQLIARYWSPREDLDSEELRTSAQGILGDLAPDAPYAMDRAFIGLVVAYLGQRALKQPSRAFLDSKTRALIGKLREPRVMQMAELLEANDARLQGRPVEAVRKLRALLDGTELFQVHVALEHALRDAGDASGADREAQWIRENRALAFAEPAGAYVVQALNVGDHASRKLAEE
jgi:putative peptide modification system cyclase